MLRDALAEDGALSTVVATARTGGAPGVQNYDKYPRRLAN
jgi:hypothetical protein